MPNDDQISRTRAAARGALMHLAPGGRVTLCAAPAATEHTSETVALSPDATPDEICDAILAAGQGGTIPRRLRIGADSYVTGTTLSSSHVREREAFPAATSFDGRDGVVRGKVALVTGAAQGFGLEIATHLVPSGALVFLVDLNEEGVTATSDEINATQGPVTHPIAADVSNEESVASMFETVSAVAGGLDLVVSNAGIVRAGSVKEIGLGDFDLVAKVNYHGFFLCTKYAARLMSAQNAVAPERSTSDIIQINSKSGLAGSNKNGAYAGSKFGGIGLVQSFALELAADRIKVNAICPGNFLDGPLWSHPETGLFVQYLGAGKVPGATSVADVKRHYESQVPLGRGCTGKDVGLALLYIVEQQYETGQAVPVTGGQIMLS